MQGVCVGSSGCNLASVIVNASSATAESTTTNRKMLANGAGGNWESWQPRKRQNEETHVSATELYCARCCVHQPVRQDGKRYVCSACGSAVEPQKDPKTCPRSPDGRHNPRRDNGAWVCSRCNLPLPVPDDEFVVLKGTR